MVNVIWHGLAKVPTKQQRPTGADQGSVPWLTGLASGRVNVVVGYPRIMFLHGAPDRA